MTISGTQLLMLECLSAFQRLPNKEEATINAERVLLKAASSWPESESYLAEQMRKNEPISAERIDELMDLLDKDLRIECPDIFRIVDVMSEDLSRSIDFKSPTRIKIHHRTSRAFLSSTENGGIGVFDYDGKLLKTIGGSPSRDFTVTADGKHLIVLQESRKGVHLFNVEDGNLEKSFELGGVQEIAGLTSDEDDKIIVLSTTKKNGTVYIYKADGTPLNNFDLSSEIEEAGSIVCHGKKIFVACKTQHFVRVFDLEGKCSQTIGSQLVTLNIRSLAISHRDTLIVTLPDRLVEFTIDDGKVSSSLELGNDEKMVQAVLLPGKSCLVHAENSLGYYNTPQ